MILLIHPCRKRAVVDVERGGRVREGGEYSKA